eukprot:CAMPEP_0184681858 /NCGR_PEP_ID=MMETSP0312-20130426/4850_1 /TAXON_ID=31354 /ORGANISM="Compsopogon coeruleus, Strain SAG 36.94" /LENGTH=443 /DNA_ID=CAMNT_0027132977 /DNA_START=232 /DNA_END=1564 /DNA_ORIENTATION=-
MSAQQWRVGSVRDDGSVVELDHADRCGDQDGEILEEVLDRSDDTRLTLKVLRLHRPKVLNALSEPMCRRLLLRWQQYRTFDSGVGLAVITGTGPRAFCAGGDVKRVWKEGPLSAESFFRAEYTLDYALGLPEEMRRTGGTPIAPLICTVMDGITMGGGAGLSMHATFRIATDHTVFAMPECAIGLHPDVGASYFLPRLEGAMGTYLALTGAQMTGLDCFRARIATHYVCRAHLPALFDDLAGTVATSHMSRLAHDVDACIQRHEPDGLRQTDGVESVAHRHDMDRIFGAPSVADIIQTLQAEAPSSEFASKSLEQLRQGSPASLTLSLLSLKRGRQFQSLADSFIQDFRLSMALTHDRESDFYEGVRAKLVDKDNQPKWREPPLIPSFAPTRIMRIFNWHPTPGQRLHYEEAVRLPSVEGDKGGGGLVRGQSRGPHHDRASLH